jgi:hypothetical protein
MYTDGYGNTGRQVCDAKGSRKQNKYQCINFVIMLVIAGVTGMLEKSFKEKSGSHSKKTFNRFNIKDVYIWNITHNIWNITRNNLKPER